MLRAGARLMLPSGRAIAVLGAAQCVYWGVLYYVFSVMLVPMRTELGVSEAAIAGAFSVGLTISALGAPTAGRWLDRGHGLALLRGGAWSAALLLWAWSHVHSVFALYVVWTGLGATMALVLYETAFALLTRAIADGAERLRALASVTVLGGLASTVFLPLAGSGVAQVGWRTTLQGLVVVWLIAAYGIERGVVPTFRGRTISAQAAATPSPSAAIHSAWLVCATATPFVIATFSAMTLTTVLIPDLVSHGYRIDTAAMVLAALGVMQLPGRVWLWRGGGRLSAHGLLVVPLGLQVAGLSVLATTSSLPFALAGVAVFGAGAGLHTLARPWVVPLLFGVASAGRVNGAIARAQGIARATGPFVAATAYTLAGGRVVFGSMAAVLLLCCPIALTLARRTAPHETRAAA